MKKYKIAVAGTGYVGLSIATLLAQHNEVVAVDIVPEKVEMINNRKSPIQDDYIEDYLANKPLNLTATLDAESAYCDAGGVYRGGFRGDCGADQLRLPEELFRYFRGGVGDSSGHGV